MKNLQLLKKILPRAEAPNRIQCLKDLGKEVIFTNGCFDLLHVGHIAYLNAARQLGDTLILGLNADESVKRLKGDTRPINPEIDRALMLAALACIDYIILFDEDTPEALITEITPDVLVKGGDYTIDDIVGADHVKDNGGIVTVIPFLKGYSSTSIINKIQELS